ncbi:GAF and ANTAR domain-containing protein [Mycobacterium sp. NPDC051804]|uniref:GAF and ANTAR domain-containing protein n=1 Tax=Mycobacterium sp. NPDC051804 TaxID=3364295 RepID=UPI00379965BB
MVDTRFADLLQKTMMDLAERFAHPKDLDATLSGVTGAAVRHIHGVDSADILIFAPPERYESIAATSALPARLDAFQVKFQEGPCLDAAIGEPLVRCDDLSSDPRWPRFGESAVAAGVHSVLSFQLYTYGTRRASLNLLGSDRNAFTMEAEAFAGMIATHAATALIAHNKELQFQSALASRDIIGQAKGMIMERFGIDAIQAFELLVRLSQNSNTRVADLAAEIVTHGPDHRSH